MDFIPWRDDLDNSHQDPRKTGQTTASDFIPWQDDCVDIPKGIKKTNVALLSGVKKFGWTPSRLNNKTHTVKKSPWTIHGKDAESNVFVLWHNAIDDGDPGKTV